MSMLVIVGGYWFFGHASRLYATHDEESLAIIGFKGLQKNDMPFIGPKASKSQVVAFIDMQCPACHDQLLELIKRSTESKDLCIFIRYFQLEGHDRALPAAIMVEKARQRIGFAKAYSIAANGMANRLPDKEILEQLGISDFNLAGSLMNRSKEYIQVEADIKLGRKIHLQGTPLYFRNVNGNAELCTYGAILMRIK